MENSFTWCKAISAAKKKNGSINNFCIIATLWLKVNNLTLTCWGQQPRQLNRAKRLRKAYAWYCLPGISYVLFLNQLNVMLLAHLRLSDFKRHETDFIYFNKIWIRLCSDSDKCCTRVKSGNHIHPCPVKNHLKLSLMEKSMKK